MSKVKVRAVVPWVIHGRNIGRDYPVEHVRAVGMTGPPRKEQPAIFTIGAPQEPDHDLWDCGTDIVWPVYEINGKPLPVDPIVPWVCRHQIEAGD